MNRKTLEILVFSGILLLATALRLGYMVELSSGPSLNQPISDAEFNDHMARSISGHPVRPGREEVEVSLDAMPFIKAPGYPFFLAGIYIAFGPGPIMPLLIQVFLGLCSMTLLYLLARRMAGFTVAAISSLFFGTYWVFIYYEGILHAPTITTTLVLLFLFLTEKWWSSLSIRRMVMLAVLGGVLVLVRKNASVFLLAILAWYVFQHRHLGKPFILSRVALGLATLFLVLLPATLRNVQHAGEWVLISCDAGRNLYMGNNEHSDGMTPYLPQQEFLTGKEGWSIFSYPELVEGFRRETHPQWNAIHTEKYFAKQAVKWVLAHPLDAVMLTAKKAYLFWGPHEISSDQVIAYDRQESSILRNLPLTFPTLFALALLGAFVAWKQQKHKPSHGFILVGLFILFYFASFLPGLPESRYRTALIPLLCLLAGIGVEQWALLLGPKQWRKAGAMAGCTLIVFFVVHWDATAYVPDRAKWAYERAIQYERRYEPEQAVRYYTMAIEARPTFVEAYHNLGILLSNSPNPGTAENAFRRAIQLKPTYFPARQSLSHFLFLQNRPSEALALAEETMAILPGDYRSYYQAGMTVLVAGHYDACVEYFTRALELNPAHAESHNNLGVVYLRLEQHEKARHHFDEALRLRPGYSAPKENLNLLQQPPPASTP